MTAAAIELEFRNVIVLAVVLTIVIVLAFRLLNKDDRTRKTRFGFFVERERYDEEDVHHLDPFSQASERPAPLPPPTPPPPLPPRPDDETQIDWPVREGD